MEYDILGIGVTIVTDCEGLHRRLKELVVRADQGRPFSGSISIEVLKRNGRYVIREGDEPPISSDDPEWATLYLHELINFRAARQLRHIIKVHAGSGSLGGRRFLLVGDKGSGKTTLTARLLFEGATVYGDETVLVQGGEAIPFPRKFHLKEGTLPLVPQLYPVCRKLTSYPAYYGGRFFFFDPTDAGCEWRIDKGGIDAVFYLEPRHGEKTEIQDCPDWFMVQKLLLQSSDFAANPESQIGELCYLVNAAGSFVMYLGELESAVMLMKHVLA